MTIHLLSETMINQIAAGEVIERPASVVKELVENAIDAGATSIEITTAMGGKSLIRVSDNGCGIPENELKLALSRHCTSKLLDDIWMISALGFRGEALPSIGSVSRLRLLSKTATAETGAEIIVTGGKISAPRPAASNCGTMVEVVELFYATPARLKFMKSDRAEATAITDIVKRIAVAFPHIRFTLSGPDRTKLDFPITGTDQKAQIGRITQILGNEFSENTVAMNIDKESVHITGFAGIPSWNRANNLQQFIYVNRRPIRDKLIHAAIRAAYEDVLARDRHAIVVLFITIDPAYVDVNVHPAKTDVRFRDPGLIRSMIITAIHHALEQAGLRSSTNIAAKMLQAFRPHAASAPATARLQLSHYLSHYRHESNPHGQQASDPHASAPFWNRTQAYSIHRPLVPREPAFQERSIAILAKEQQEKQESRSAITPVATSLSQTLDPTMGGDRLDPHLAAPLLGIACAQIHQNYIIAQTEDSLIIVDQHAAHERLVYETLKRALYAEPLHAQMLLIADIIELPQIACETLLLHTETFQKLGLIIDQFGPDALIVRATPAILGQVDTKRLIHDLADEITESDHVQGLKSMLDHMLATMACHGSVRSGRILKLEEMDKLLRQMEMVPASGTCNHGRPTYIELKLSDIEHLFGRR